MRYRRSALLCGWLGLLAGITLCGCKSSEKEAEDAKKQSIKNLIDIGIGMHNYASANGGDRFPSPGLPDGMKQTDFWASRPDSWRFSLLPYVEKADLYSQGVAAGKGPLPDAVRNAVVSTYLNPLVKEQTAKTNYRVFVGNGAAFEWGKTLTIPSDFPDGLDKTILVVEAAEPIDWASLDDFEYDPNKPLPKLGIFPGGFHALMGDGLVRWIPADTDENAIRAMITRNGKEQIPLAGKHAGSLSDFRK
jgi:hypothetical protein